MNKLKEEFLKLLREDVEFRYAVLGLLGIEEILRRIDKNTEAIKALQKQMIELQKQMREHGLILEEHTKALRSLQEQVISLQRRIDALGARWGLLAEEAFRESMKGILEKILGKIKVEKWSYYDKEGEVFGYPSLIEVDMVIKDREHFLIEIKSSTSRGDVHELYRIGKLYERVVKVKPKLMIVTCYADNSAKEAAKVLGVELYHADGYRL